jgi:NAD-dependent dihydropyrimidine dehydrogenase PreA subunit
MSATENNLKGEAPTILLCRCADREPAFSAAVGQVQAALEQARIPHLAVPDLCDLAGRRSPALREMLAGRPLRIVACYPRAVKWLLHAAGHTLAAGVDCYNLRVESADTVAARLVARAAGGEMREGTAPASVPPVAEPPSPGPGTPSPAPPESWAPWFPVIDFDRCNNCRQCLSFCLFGVYSRDERGWITVADPQSCKNNCPACARVCPEAAIIFPKFNQAPVDGSPVDDQSADQGRVKVNLAEVLGTDAYAALAARRKQSRTRLVKDPVVDES